MLTFLEALLLSRLELFLDQVIVDLQLGIHLFKFFIELSE